MSMEMVSSKQESMEELITALEKATLMTKQLQNTINPSQLHQIYTSLHSAHHHLTKFLLNQPPPENTMSSAVSGGDEDDGDELMHVADQEEAEQSSKSLDGVEKKLKDWCFVQNKRRKRMLSPSEEEEKEVGGGGGRDGDGVDSHEKKLRALELIYQFHS